MLVKGVRTTKLERYLIKWRIKPVDLAKWTGFSRQHLLRVRKGRMEPSRLCIKAITKACRGLSGRPVTALDLFDLGDEDD
jgi:predicted transcriptional regulator